MARQSKVDQLDRCVVLLDILRTDQETYAALRASGFSEETLTNGEPLYENARRLRVAAHDAHSDQLDATEQLNRLRHVVESNIGALSTLARTLFRKDEVVQEQLGLRRGQRATPALAVPRAAPDDGSATETTPPPPRRARSQSQAALIDRGYLLYEGIITHPELHPIFADSGFPLTRIQEERALIDQLQAAEGVQERRKDDAIAASLAAQQAIDELKAWASRVRAGIRASQRHRPDLIRRIS